LKLMSPIYSKNLKFRFGKKGQVIGLLAYGLMTVFVAIGFLFLAFFISEINTSIQGSDEFSDEIKTSFGRTNSTLPNVLDASYALMVVLAALVLIASVLFIDTSPVFMAFSIPIFLVVILGNAIFANLIDEFGRSAALAATYDNFPMMQFFAANWVTVVVVVGFLSIIAFFGGKGGGER